MICNANVYACVYLCVAPKWTTKEHMAVWVMGLCWLWLGAEVNSNGRKQSVVLLACCLPDLEDAGSKTLPLPTVYPFPNTSV